VLVLAVVDDRLVHLVASDPDRLGDDDASQGDHRHLARAAADVQHHAPGGLGYGEAGADRRSHRLLDQVGLAGARGEARLLDRPLLHAGHAGGNADDHSGVGEAVLVNALDEVPQHLLCDVEIGDDAVLEGTNRLDGARGPAQHALRAHAHRVDLARARVHGHHGGLGEHDPATPDVDQRVRGTEVNRHVAATEAGEISEDAHACGAAGAGRRSVRSWSGKPGRRGEPDRRANVAEGQAAPSRT
jgi:hypothetical protein